MMPLVVAPLLTAAANSFLGTTARRCQSEAPSLRVDRAQLCHVVNLDQSGPLPASQSSLAIYVGRHEGLKSGGIECDLARATLPEDF
jgi:hypothetical protein